jgi:hypothetical protein
MSQTELKMQPTTHLQGKPGYFSRPYSGLPRNRIAGCTLNSIGLTITRETSCIVWQTTSAVKTIAVEHFLLYVKFTIVIKRENRNRPVQKIKYLRKNTMQKVS